MSAVASALARAEAADAGIAPPRDTPYPGTIKLHVDASDTAQGIFRVHETIPVRPGELTLLYPKWIPGHHSPTGPIDKLAGLAVTANGKPLAWTRAVLDVYAFRVDVPKDVRSIEVDFQFLSARTQPEGPIQMTDALLDLEWPSVALYPGGHYSRRISFAASVTLPHGWQFATPLEQRSRKGDTTHFKPVPFDLLVDSPLVAGLYFKRVDLDPGAKVPVHLDLFADAPKHLEMSPQQLQAHRALVAQAYKLFGSRHYEHYDFLFWQSDVLGGKGLEHHQCSEDGVKTGYFSDWDERAPRRDLLAHEYTHSWNGKFRRPARLATASFNVPMDASLLWVYEGQTQYWGFVLTARAGLWSAEQYRDALALVAADYDRNRPGFQWRALTDTTNDPTIARRAPLPYRNWQMSEDYYNAGQLIWLAVDARIRALTHGRKSLDSFAKAFFGIKDGSVVTLTYTLEDVIAALDAVVKSDWRRFLQARLDAHRAPMDGLAASGWKLVYTETESAYQKHMDKLTQRPTNFTWSIGLALNKDGSVFDVRWGGPAHKAGITSGAKLVAADGHAYKPEVLADAITAAKGRKAPIELLLRYQDRYKTVRVPYHDGLQYPHLVRAGSKPDYLSQIIKAR